MKYSLLLIIIFIVQLLSQPVTKYLDAGFYDDFYINKEIFFDRGDVANYDDWYPSYYGGDWGNEKGSHAYWEKKDLTQPDPRFGYMESIPGNPDMVHTSWNIPDTATGDWTNARVIKFDKLGRLLVNSSDFSLDSTLYILIRYRDDLANQIITDPNAAATPGAPVYIHSGLPGNGRTNYHFLGYIGGGFDHRWKTVLFEVPSNQWGLISKYNSTFIAIKIGSLDYQRTVVGSIPIDKIMITDSQPGNPGLFEADTSGYWPSLVDRSKFSNVYQTRTFELGGEPEFLYGIYLMRQEATEYESTWSYLKGAKMNVVVDYKWLEDLNTVGPLLDKALQNGLKYLLWEPGLFYGSGYMVPEKYQSTNSFLNDYIDNVVNQYKHHPALLGWYLVDEFSNDGDTKNHVFIREFYDRVKNADPDHPTFLVTQGFHLNPEFALIDKTVGDVDDILAVDAYLNSDVSRRLLTQGYYLHTFREYNTAYSSNPKPLILVPQGPERNMEPNNYDYGNYIPIHNDNIIDGKLIKTQAYNGITQGVRGLIYFTRGCNPDNTTHQVSERQSYIDVWNNGFNSLGEELFGTGNLAEILLSEGDEIYKSVNSTSTAIMPWGYNFHYVNYLVKKVDQGPYSGTYVVAVNLDSELKSVRFEVTNLPASIPIKRLFEGGNIISDAGFFEDTIEGFGRRAYKIDPQANRIDKPKNLQIAK